MAIYEADETRPILDLSGPEGNAFNLMGVASNLFKQLGKDSKPVIDEMKSGDYAHLVYIFHRECGDFFDIKLPHNMSVSDIEKAGEEMAAQRAEKEQSSPPKAKM